MFIIKENINNSQIISTLTYLKRYADEIYVVGGAAAALQSTYKTKDVDLLNFPYIEKMEKDKAIKVYDYSYFEDSSIRGFRKIKVKNTLVDIVYDSTPYNNFSIKTADLEFVTLRGFNIQSIKSLFLTSKPFDDEKLEALIRDNSLPIDYIYKFKSKENKLKFLLHWESVFGELEIEQARKLLK